MKSSSGLFSIELRRVPDRLAASMMSSVENFFFFREDRRLLFFIASNTVGDVINQLTSEPSLLGSPPVTFFFDIYAFYIATHHEQDSHFTVRMLCFGSYTVDS